MCKVYWYSDEIIFCDNTGYIFTKAQNENVTSEWLNSTSTKMNSAT